MGIKSVISFGLICVPLLANSAFSDEITRIETKEDFLEFVVGKKLGNEKHFGEIKPDGTWSWSLREGTIKGKWEWQNKFFCRDGKINGENIGYDCQIIAVSEGQFYYRREMGAGPSGIVPMF